MTTQLGKALSYQITADTSQFSKGVTLTRQETRAAQKVMEASLTPIQRYESQHKALKTLLDKGAISQEAYTASAAELREELVRGTSVLAEVVDVHDRHLTGTKQSRLEMLQGVPVVGQYAQRFQGLTPAIAAGGAAAIAAAAGFKLVTATISAGINTIAESSRMYAEQGSALLKLSRQTHVSVSDLSLLQSISRQTGVDFDDMSGAVEEAQIRIGEAVLDGTGPAIEALAKLGLSAQDLERQGMVDRLKTIADRLGEVTSASQRQFLADEIFGGDAFKILPLLDQGADGIARLAEQAQQLGGLFDERDAILAAGFNRAVGDARQVIKGLAFDIGREALPAMKTLVEEFSQLSNRNSELGKAIHAGIGLIGPALELGLAAANDVIGKFQIAQSAISGTFAVILTGAEAADKLISQITGKKRNAELQAFAETFRTETASLFNEGLARTQREFNFELPDAVEQAKESADQLGREMSEASEAAAATARESKQIDKALQGAQSIAQSLRGFIEQQATQITDPAEQQLVMLEQRIAQARREAKGTTDGDEQARQLERVLVLEQQLDRARSTANTARNAQQRFDLMERGRKLTEQLRTNEEKLAAEQKDLQKLFAVGAIDVDTFARAMKAAQEKFDKPVTIRYEVTGVDAAIVGSQRAAESIARFQRDAVSADGQITGGVRLSEARQALNESVDVAIKSDAEVAENWKTQIELLSRMATALEAGQSGEQVNLTAVDL